MIAPHTIATKYAMVTATPSSTAPTFDPGAPLTDSTAATGTATASATSAADAPTAAAGGTANSAPTISGCTASGSSGSGSLHVAANWAQPVIIEISVPTPYPTGGQAISAMIRRQRQPGRRASASRWRADALRATASRSGSGSAAMPMRVGRARGATRAVAAARRVAAPRRPRPPPRRPTRACPNRCRRRRWSWTRCRPTPSSAPPSRSPRPAPPRSDRGAVAAPIQADGAPGAGQVLRPVLAGVGVLARVDRPVRVRRRAVPATRPPTRGRAGSPWPRRRSSSPASPCASPCDRGARAAARRRAWPSPRSRPRRRPLAPATARAPPAGLPFGAAPAVPAAPPLVVPPARRARHASRDARARVASARHASDPRRPVVPADRPQPALASRRAARTPPGSRGTAAAPGPPPRRGGTASPAAGTRTGSR